MTVALMLDRVGMLISTTGTGTVTANTTISDFYHSPAEAGAVDGKQYWWMLEEGTNFELFIGTWGLASTTISRDQVVKSKVGGVAGTSKINLTGAATLRSISTAEAFEVLRRGGASVVSGSSSINLTKYSERSQNLTFTALGKSVTLPDATTYSAYEVGGPVFSFMNSGNYEYAVRRSDGTILCVVAPAGAVELYLDSNGTAAGTWHYSADPASLAGGLRLVEQQYTATYTNNAGASSYKAVALSSTVSLHFMVTASATFVFAIDNSTGTVGTPQQIDSAVVNIWAVATSSTTAQIAWNNSTTFKTAVVSVSGTTVTVNTAATAASTNPFTGPAAIPNRQPVVAQAGQYFVFQYRDGSNNLSVLPIYYNGTTSYIGSPVTFGASATVNNSVNATYPLDSTHVLLAYTDDSGSGGAPFSVRAAVATVSGTTSPAVAVGTSAGVNDVVDDVVQLPVCKHSATLFTIGYRKTSTNYPTVVGVTVSGTTVTFGTPVTIESVAIDAGTWHDRGFGLAANTPYPDSTLFPISATTALMNWWVDTSSTPSRSVVITNTSGTITVGTIVYGLGGPLATLSTGSIHNISTSTFVFIGVGSTAGAANEQSILFRNGTVSGTTVSHGGVSQPDLTNTMGQTLSNNDSQLLSLGNYVLYMKSGSREMTAIARLVGNKMRYEGDIPAGSIMTFTQLTATKIAISGIPGARFADSTGTARPRFIIVELPS